MASRDEDGFFEEDEPIEDIRARRARRQHDVVTANPHGSRTLFFDVGGGPGCEATVSASGEVKVVPYWRRRR